MDKLNFLNKCRTDLKFRQSVIEQFHKLYYYSSQYGGTWKDTTWLGIPSQKCPLDLWIYQEIIFKNKPNFIIETGTGSGGSTSFLASILSLIGNGEVISVDKENNLQRPCHKRIKYMIGSSTDSVITTLIKSIIEDPIMVILDSDHSKEHVLKELEIYSKFVTKGQYLIVEDTNDKGYPVNPEQSEGAMDAVQEFLKQNKDFEVDPIGDKFLMTFNPSGYLRRIK